MSNKTSYQLLQHNTKPMIVTQHQTNDCNTTPNKRFQHNTKQKIETQHQIKD
jgi:hypothetical protein